MGRPFPSLSQLIERECRRWTPFRQALSKPDQEAFESLFACITRHLQADVYLSRPRTFEAIILAALLEHENRITELVQELIVGLQEVTVRTVLLLPRVLSRKQQPASRSRLDLYLACLELPAAREEVVTAPCCAPGRAITRHFFL
jgi:hypothetical protein